MFKHITPYPWTVGRRGMQTLSSVWGYETEYGISLVAECHGKNTPMATQRANARLIAIKRQRNEPDYDRLYQAYEGLIEWIGKNEVDGQETLGLLVKAAVALAVTNNLPKDDIMEVVAVTYEMERSMRPRADEVH